MSGFLGIATLVLIFVVIFQIAKVIEMSAVLRDEGKAATDAYHLNGFLLLVFMILGAAGIVWCGMELNEFLLPEASSEHGIVIDSLFNWTLVSTGIVFVLTQVCLFWFAYKYKYKEGAKVHFFVDDMRLEIIWTAVPAVVMIALVVMGLQGWYAITGPAPPDAMIMEVNGRQFEWILRYPGEDGKLGRKNWKMINLANNPLGQDWEDSANHDDFIAVDFHMQVNKPLLVKINAQDVLHGFYLPHFRAKIDAVPGMPTQFWFTPTKTTAEMRELLGKPEFNYEMACAELCGKGHFSMRKLVIVETEEEYNAWVKEQKSYYQTMVLGETETAPTADLEPAEEVSEDTEDSRETETAGS